MGRVPPFTVLYQLRREGEEYKVGRAIRCEAEGDFEQWFNGFVQIMKADLVKWITQS